MSPALRRLLGRIGGTLLVVLVVAVGFTLASLVTSLLAMLALGADADAESVTAWVAGRPLLVTALGWVVTIPALVLLARFAFGLQPGVMGLRRPPGASPRRPRFLAGVACGLLLILAPAAVARLFGGFVAASPAELAALTVPTGLSAIPSIVYMLPALIFAALGEEVLFRGLLLRFWEPVAGTRGALVLSAVLFSAIHLSNPGASPLGLIGVVLAGLMLGLIFLARGDLWLAAGVHLGWNAAEAMVLGVPVSGLMVPSLLRWSVADSDAARGLLGSGFGPEEGLLFHAALATGIVATLALSRGPREAVAPTDEDPGPGHV